MAVARLVGMPLEFAQQTPVRREPVQLGAARTMVLQRWELRSVRSRQRLLQVFRSSEMREHLKRELLVEK